MYVFILQTKSTGEGYVESQPGEVNLFINQDITKGKPQSDETPQGRRRKNGTTQEHIRWLPNQTEVYTMTSLSPLDAVTIVITSWGGGGVCSG